MRGQGQENKLGPEDRDDRDDQEEAGWLASVVAALRPRLPAYLNDLATLVNLDSGTFDREDVERVGAWLRARCRSWGAAIDEHDGGEQATSFCASLIGTGVGAANVGAADVGIGKGNDTVSHLSHMSGPTLVLLGHMDTVFAHGTAAMRPFRLEDGRAMGPGVCDMKGGLLVAIYAIEALRTLSYNRFATLHLICTSDEEIGAPSSRAFLERIATNSDAVLVLEAARANGDLVSQRRGWGSYRLEVTGRSAHAGVEPQAGRSAALTLCQQILALHALNDYSAGRMVNVGTLQAGTRPNVVPDHAVAEVDLRADTTQQMEQLLTEAEAALAGAAIEGTNYRWTPTGFRPPWGSNAGASDLLLLAQGVARELDFTVDGATTGGTSDGNFTAALGIATLDGLGPVGGLDHGPQEYIEVVSIVPRIALLAGLIRAVCEARVRRL